MIDVSLRPDDVQSLTLGSGMFLNDNQPHTLTIYHNPDLQRFEYVLDSDAAVRVPHLAGVTPDFGPGGVFLGGVPPTITALAALVNETFFIGCLEDVLLANSTISSSSVANSVLQGLGLVRVGGNVQDGCVDPCLAVSCGQGVCVRRWPDRAFCDCRGTGMMGASCSEGELES